MIELAIASIEGMDVTISRAATIGDLGGATVAARSGRTLLLRARELRGPLSLVAAAVRIGIRPDELGKIERGETKQVRWETLLGMADAYNVEVGELLVATPPPQDDAGYAGVLYAIRSGRLAASMPPRRFAHDPDALLTERERDADAPSPADVAAFAEAGPLPSVRRPAFRPADR